MEYKKSEEQSDRFLKQFYSFMVCLSSTLCSLQPNVLFFPEHSLWEGPTEVP